MGDWKAIYSASGPQEAQLVKGLLEAHGIAAVVLDQVASPYPPMGEAVVLVRPEDVVRALYLVRKHQQEE